jgi:hypothetical protein
MPISLTPLTVGRRELSNPAQKRQSFIGSLLVEMRVFTTE